MNLVRVRIAPSPTGEDLHIGNVYTALLNFVFACGYKGKFIVRIEDTDKTRLVKGAEEKILKSLRWFGLTYDEGPDVGGKYGPYRQSERLELYQNLAHQLVENRFAYYCICSSSRLKKMRLRQQAAGKPTLYDGKCKKERISRSQLKKDGYVIRMDVPDEGRTEFIDIIKGKISFENTLIDDQIILKSDGYPTYHLAVVVDDYYMKISHVIRAEEWISSTPKHILLYKALGWPLPFFAHGPILRNPDRSKLSKRKNPVWVSWYKKEGYLPDAILNYLALMGWSMPDESEIFTLEQMTKYFRLEDLKPAGAVFDIRKLEWLNGEYIRKTQISKLKTQILKFYNNKLPDDVVEGTIPLISERIKKLSDYLPLCEFFFKGPKKYEIDLSSKKDLFISIIEKIEILKEFDALNIGKSMQELASSLKIKNSEFFMLLRVAITGKKISPPLNESMEVLGQEEVIKRLKDLI